VKAVFDHYPTESDIESDKRGRFREVKDEAGADSTIYLDGREVLPLPGETRWDARKRAERIWHARLSYVRQEQTYPSFHETGKESFWLVKVDQVVLDMNEEKKSDFLVHYFRVNHDGRTCHLGTWNRDREKIPPPVAHEDPEMARCP
jgi:hypothetical protein